MGFALETVGTWNTARKTGLAGTADHLGIGGSSASLGTWPCPPARNPGDGGALNGWRGLEIPGSLYTSLDSGLQCQGKASALSL